MSDLIERLREVADEAGAHGYGVSGLLREAADALEAARGDGWQPIETAPRDSVYRDGNNHYAEYILVCSGHYDTPRRARFWFRDDSDSSDFIADGGIAVYPTHWMPLPTPPKESE